MWRADTGFLLVLVKITFNNGDSSKEATFTRHGKRRSDSKFTDVPTACLYFYERRPMIGLLMNSDYRWWKQ